MPQGRGNHGCGTTTIKKQLHLVVFGGYNFGDLASINLFNFATQQWTAAPAPMALPTPITNIKAAKIIQMDEKGCDMMFINSLALYICSGSYEWKTIGYGQIEVGKNIVIVGANDLLPCGV